MIVHMLVRVNKEFARIATLTGNILALHEIKYNFIMLWYLFDRYIICIIL